MGNNVAIINHGLSNLNSIARAVEECGGVVTVTDERASLKAADRIILPGVGSFAAAMANLKAKGLDDGLRDEVARRSVPVLGICLGMQLLGERSTEGGSTEGIGLVSGSVVKLVPTGEDESIPHMGWNEVNPVGCVPLFNGISGGTNFYFVHSYHLVSSGANVAAKTPFCGGFISAVSTGCVMAVQFHPEKSQRAGFRLLNNFMTV